MGNEVFAEILKETRNEAGKSQEHMAKALKVSKKTVQNYESGYSQPTIPFIYEWFRILKIDPLPYMLRILYPHEFSELSPKADDKKIEDALIKYIKGMRAEDKRKLLFVIYGEHGSSFGELIEMFTAHFHTPEENRITIAQNICTNYEIAAATHKLVALDHVKPDLNILKRAIIRKRNKILGTNDELRE